MSSEYVCGDKTQVFSCNSQITFAISNVEEKNDVEQAKEIKRYWSKKVKNNPRLFNGEVLSVRSVEKSPQKVKIVVEKKGYEHLVYTMNHMESEIVHCKSVAVGGFLETIDGFIILGKMAEHTSFPGVIQCIGGGLSKEDIIEGNPIEGFLRECKEEIGLLAKDIISIDDKKFIYIRKNQTTVGICYYAHLNKKRKEIQRLFSQIYTDGEIEQLIFVKNEKECIKDFLAKRLVVDYVRIIFERRMSSISFDDFYEYDF